MKLTSSNEELADNKILVLYILNKLDKPIDSDNLFKLILHITDMNYFYLQQFLFDLLQNSFINKYEQDNKFLYEISDNGKKALSLTENFLPGIFKLNIDNNFKPEIRNIEETNSISSEFKPLGKKDFYVTCKITENNQTQFEFSIIANSINETKVIIDNWKNNTTEIYNEILKLLKT